MLNMNSYYNPNERQSLDYHKELLKKAKKTELIREAMQAHSKPADLQMKLSLKGFFLRLKGLKFTNKTSSMRPT